MEADTLLRTKSKLEVAAAVRAAYSGPADQRILEPILDRILTNEQSLSNVDDEETMDWCQWLIAGGSTPEEFTETVKLYDKATTCGLVWTENFVAYRCRTCGISPYLSLCTDCFHKGNHDGHDFIVFKSETGGACDCGELNVIKESGCCVLHGPRGTAAMERAEILAGRNGNSSGSQEGSDPSLSPTKEQSAPFELLCIANGMMPRLFHRLIAFLRATEARKLARAQQISKNNKNSIANRPKTSPAQPVSLAATAAAMIANPAVSAPPKGHKFIKLLQGFSDMGVAMRQVMTSALSNTSMYQLLCGSLDSEYEKVGMKILDHHKTFLEELVYWTVKREFPEDLVCFLLSLRSESSYNEAFARAFITHYELISQSILKSSDPERLCKHIAAVSVQLFSKEKLAIAMVEQMQLLHLLLSSLYDMIRSTAVPISAFPVLRLPSSGEKMANDEEEGEVLHQICNEDNNVLNDNSLKITDEIWEATTTLKVIDCDNDIIKNNYYWLIKSDLKELLTHGPVAAKFFKDNSLLSTWFDFLTLLQGMNVNKFVTKGEPHVEHESESYVGAFMAELVISATLMWTLVSHLKDESNRDVTLSFIQFCRNQLIKWYRYVQYPKGTISFHLPLHRYLSTFIQQGLRFQNIQLEELLPSEYEIDLILQQLIRLQAASYGISTRLWARNGPSLVNQAEYYVSSLCCNSMIDADLFMLQIASVRNNGTCEDAFMKMILEEFAVIDMLCIQKCLGEKDVDGRESSVEESMDGIMSKNPEPEEQMTMLENFMIFLATLTTVRTNLGIADKDLMSLEMSVLLCKSDKLHSELMELLPERCGNDAQQKNFESVLAEIADFQAPRNMQQGIFTPKSRVWEDIYDPIFTMLRSSNRADYQCSRDRYQDYVSRSKKDINSKNIWPPFRLPSFKPSFVRDPAKLLLSKSFMEVAFVILYHGVYTGIYSELVVSLCVYLLEVAVYCADSGQELHEFLTEIPVPSKNTENYSSSLRRESHKESQSITSLLMQLYTKLSGESKTYSLKPDVEDVELDMSCTESRIGDGSFFVMKVLDKIAEKFSAGRIYIQNEIGKNQMEQCSMITPELSAEEKEREEKRRKAKERKLHLMNEYAMKRQQFSQTQSVEIDETIADNPSPIGDQGPSSLFERFQDHECVICMEKLESKPSNPFGLMTYLSPCNILEYQRLHSPEGDGPFLKTIHKETLQDLRTCYEDSSVLQHIPLDPGFGVQVQSCGHLIHQDCFTSYMNYVKRAPSPSQATSNKNVSSFTYKEYSCPLCRQLGNSFLPMIFNTTSAKDNQVSGSFTEIAKLIKKKQRYTLSNSETTAIESFIKDINACAVNNFQPGVLKLLENFDVASPIVSAFLQAFHLRQFVSQQLKLNDNAAGSSSSANTKPSTLLPILSVIKHKYRTLPVGYSRKLAQNWEMICGKRISKGKGEVPTLLKDVDTEIFHFILDLPILDKVGGGNGLCIFNGVIQALYNLRVVQVMSAIGSQFSDVECQEIIRVYSQSQTTLEKLLSLIMKNILGVKSELTSTAASNDDLMNADENGNHKNFDIPETLFLENLAQSLLIPYLNTAAYLKSEIFGETSFKSGAESGSFSGLVEYLELGGSHVIGNNGEGERSLTDFLFWRQDEKDEALDCEAIIENWCSELIQSISVEKEANTASNNNDRNNRAVELLKSHLYVYDKPSLVKLPTEYDTIFENYRKIKCQRCDSVPSSPILCLICGEMLCLNELCCFDVELEVSEVVSHCHKKCGRTGLFLSIMTSEILIVREKEACIWGSIFLDSFCEEDLELKRGKPLFLCQERLDILQRNWITQSFYKSELKWFQHENVL